jgi:site-specific recombinase XerD
VNAVAHAGLPYGVPAIEASGDFELIAEWRDVLSANDLEPETQRNYVYGVWRLAEFHGFRTHLWDMEPAHVASFVASMPPRSTVKQHYMKGIRSFYRFLVARNYVLSDPTALVNPRRRQRSSAPESFTHDDLVQLIYAAWHRSPRRAWAIYACYAVGCRRTEFVNIRLEDIDWQRDRVYLRQTKFDKPRFVPMGEQARLAIGELSSFAVGAMLLPIRPNTFTHWVHQAGIDAGFSGRKLRAHTLRASYITDLANAGNPVHVIAANVGHNDVKTTSVYLAVNEQQRADASI